MAAEEKSPFAALLDTLFVAATPQVDVPAEDDAVARPSIPFDYMAVADELHSGRIKLAAEAMQAEYQDTGPSYEAALAEIIAEAAPAPMEELPPADPVAIRIELGLDKPGAPLDLGHVRRAFAFRNHPDRVAPHLRERAMARMQIANMLIDDAKRLKLASR